MFCIFLLWALDSTGLSSPRPVIVPRNSSLYCSVTHKLTYRTIIVYMCEECDKNDLFRSVKSYLPRFISNRGLPRNWSLANTSDLESGGMLIKSPYLLLS